MELQLIEQTLEAEYDNWVYRFHVNEQGVLVRRVHKDGSRPWSHPLLAEIFDRDENAFRPAMRVPAPTRFNYLDEAVAVVKELTSSLEIVRDRLREIS